MGHGLVWHSKDCQGFRAFLEEATKVVHAIEEAACDREKEARMLHTLGCNAARFGFPGLAEFCDVLARRLARGLDDLGTLERFELSHRFHQVLEAYLPLDEAATVTIGEGRIRRAARHAGLGGAAASADRAGRVARARRRSTAGSRASPRTPPRSRSRSGRPPSRRTWRPTARATTSVASPRSGARSCTRSPTRSSTASRRRRSGSPAGKPRAARLELNAESRGGRLFVELRDDGRGVQWSRLAARARALGLSVLSERDLSEAVFWDGVSSSDPETGRGLGLGALREACDALGGTVEIESRFGVGTTLRCAFPQIGRWPRAARSTSVFPPRALDRLVRDTLRTGGM